MWRGDEHLCGSGTNVEVRRFRTLPTLELLKASYGRWAFPRHVHEEYVIGVMTAGAESLRCENRRYIASRGSLILLNPGQAHSNCSVDEDGFAYSMCYLPEPLLRAIFENHDMPTGPASFTHPVVERSPAAGQLLKLHDALSDANSALENESCLTDTILRVFACHSQTSLGSPQCTAAHIVAAREYLEAHFAENITLRDLAVVAGIGPFHFLRTFRKQVGLPPAEYQSHLRLVRAKALLQDGVPIAQVAFEVGFADQSHLTRRFKAVVGMTPGAYRRDVRLA